MPLHMTGLVSRRNLDHPEEKPPVAPLAYEKVLKYNPNHSKEDGRFSSGKEASTSSPEKLGGRPTEEQKQANRMANNKRIYAERKVREQGNLKRTVQNLNENDKAVIEDAVQGRLGKWKKLHSGATEAEVEAISHKFRTQEHESMLERKNRG